MKKTAPCTLNTRMTIRWEEGRCFSIQDDCISPEFPLAIRLLTGTVERREKHELVVTMRSPGQDKELAMGYLFSEGIIGQAGHVQRMLPLAENQMEVHLHPDVIFSPPLHIKSNFSNSACGLCSKTNLDQLEQMSCYFPRSGVPLITTSTLTQLSKMLYQQQSLFKLTGGMHAAALFDQEGQLLLSREDVGRHNAMDKLLGSSLQQGILPWRNKIVLVSSRVSYELVQKAAMAGTPILAALGAPTTMAIEMAEQSGMTIVGFLRADRFNIYTYSERIRV